MKLLKNISRFATILIPGKGNRKTARLKAEDFLNALFCTEKYRCQRHFEKEFGINKNLPQKDYHIVSLGTNCFARMTLNLWGLKPRKAEGGLSMPFDLSVHPLSAVIKYLNNHFAGYFDDIEFDEKNGYWVNPRDNIKFIHEKENNRQAFIERYQQRIENLYAAFNDDKPCLLVCHDCGIADGDKINELYNVLQNYCGHKKFKLLLAVFNGTVGKCDENIKVYTDNFPYKGYLYMDKNVKYTMAGFRFERPFVCCCREEVINLLENK